jgi:hypothetical protein
MYLKQANDSQGIYKIITSLIRGSCQQQVLLEPPLNGRVRVSCQQQVYMLASFVH